MRFSISLTTSMILSRGKKLFLVKIRSTILLLWDKMCFLLITRSTTSLSLENEIYLMIMISTIPLSWENKICYLMITRSTISLSWDNKMFSLDNEIHDLITRKKMYFSWKWDPLFHYHEKKEMYFKMRLTIPLSWHDMCYPLITRSLFHVFVITKINVVFLW